MGIISNAVQNATPAEAMDMPPVENEAAAPSQTTEDPMQPNDDAGLEVDWQNPDAVRGQMKIPQELEDAYNKIVKAGLKVMFDPSTRRGTMDFINESSGEPEKLAEGVMSVVVTLYQQSNDTLPPNLLIPSAIELLVHAASVAKEGGMEVDNEFLAEAIAETVKQILVKFGASPDAMQKMMSGMDSDEEPMPTPRAPPTEAV